MGIAILHSRAQLGIEAPPVTIEVFLSGGLPMFSIVGMAETALRESKDRVRSALINSGFKFPQERITVSLGPADLPKGGGRFDLAIALGILIASGQLPADVQNGVEFYAELALSGELRPVRGLLPAAMAAQAAGRSLLVSRGNGREATLAGGRVVAARSLLEVTGHLGGMSELDPLPDFANRSPRRDSADLAEVRGQERARRALEIAATGGHNLLFVGPPGTGKSMLARRLPGILPELSDAEALEVAAVESVLGREVDLATWRRRPFRAPHHTASSPALVGGGAGPLPGEVSRAHRGVLFLDELPEFNRQVLEVLREPLEAGSICIARAARQAEFPARFQLIAAMNPCPCGFRGDEHGDCNCSAERVANYRGKISGPLLDRIDLQVDVNRPPLKVLREKTAAESSAVVAARVATARDRQLQRQGGLNAWLEADALAAEAQPEALDLLERAAEPLCLSARAWQRVLRVGRSIADLAGDTTVAPLHVAEALSFRLSERLLQRPGHDQARALVRSLIATPPPCSPPRP